MFYEKLTILEDESSFYKTYAEITALCSNKK